MNHPQHGDPRAELVERLTYMHALLRWMDEKWQEKDAVAQRYQDLIPLKDKWGFARYMMWLGILTVGVTMIVTGILRAIGRREMEEVGRSSLVNTDPVSVGILVFPAALVLAFVVVVVHNKFVLPRQHERAVRVNRQREEHNAVVRVEEEQVDAQISRAGHDFATHIGNSYPQEYLYEEAVVYCIQMVRNHRAGSVGEAINLYEAEQHNRRVMNMQQAQLDESKRMRKQQMVSTAVNAAMTGAAIHSMRKEGARNRAAQAANTDRITSELRKPRDVYIRPRNSWGLF